MFEVSVPKSEESQDSEEGTRVPRNERWKQAAKSPSRTLHSSTSRSRSPKPWGENIKSSKSNKQISSNLKQSPNTIRKKSLLWRDYVKGMGPISTSSTELNERSKDDKRKKSPSKAQPTGKESPKMAYSAADLYTRSRSTDDSQSLHSTSSKESAEKRVFKCKRKSKSTNIESGESAFPCGSIKCYEKQLSKKKERMFPDDYGKETLEPSKALKRHPKRISEGMKEAVPSDTELYSRPIGKTRSGTPVSTQSVHRARKGKEKEDEYEISEKPKELLDDYGQETLEPSKALKRHPKRISEGIKEAVPSDTELYSRPIRKTRSGTPVSTQSVHRARKGKEKEDEYEISQKPKELLRKKREHTKDSADISDEFAVGRIKPKLDKYSPDRKKKIDEKVPRKHKKVEKTQKGDDYSEQPLRKVTRKADRKEGVIPFQRLSSDSTRGLKSYSSRSTLISRMRSRFSADLNVPKAFPGYVSVPRWDRKKKVKERKPSESKLPGFRSRETLTSDAEYKDGKYFDSSTKGKRRTSLMNEAGYTEILASLVPDEIIYYVHETKYRKYDVCLLFGDASGFTDLCERYSKAGKGGPSRLTVVLNSFIGTMVQEIMTHGGDVLKFSGDAFLAWWRTDENITDLQDCVTAAIETAMIIQKSFGKYETDVQVTLRVKLAISAGQVAFSSIGTEDTKHYVVLGTPVWDVKIAEYLCVAGDIMVAPKAWVLINAQEYDYEVMPDGQHVKVLGAGAGWRQMQGYSGGPDSTAEVMDDDWEAETRGIGSILFMVGGEEDDDHSDESDTSLIDEDGRLHTVGSQEQTGDHQKDETLSLRPSVTYAVKRKMKMLLRPYVIKPVLKGLDMDEPIEYLTEMRQVVIVFTNLVTLNPPMGKMIKLVNECYRIVCSSVHAHQGCVNKVSLFDKDMMFLIIFGLRGFKHELESQIALRCGAELHERLSTVDMVRMTSVGITTGMTYCGVVGHTLRREYSVIGPTVNKAARIMVAYPGKVTCDRETFLHSRLDSGNFILQEHKELKGLHQAGPIYEFREHLMPKKTHVLSKFPLLSRDDEMGLFQVLCDEAKLRYRPLNRRISAVSLRTLSQRMRGMQDTEKPYVMTGNIKSALKETARIPDRWKKSNRYFISGLVIRAEPRMGKSRLLDEMIHCSRAPDVKVARIALTPKDYQMTLFGINRILEPILNFPDNASYREKEERLLQLLRFVPETKWQYLYTLNELFQTTIDFSRTHPSDRYPDPLRAMKRALWVLLSQAIKTFWIIGIDDLEFLDTASWTLLPVLLEKEFGFFVMALGNRLDLATSSEEILTRNKHLYHVSLGGIDKWYQVGLACQILDVWAIPPELERLIHERSGGNPGWVESYLVTQIQQDVLKVTSMTQDEADAMGLVRPPARMITRAAARKSRSAIDPTRMHPTEDRWEMFKSCYHESKENVAKTAGDKLTAMWGPASAPDVPITQNMRLRLLQFAGNMAIKKTRGDKVIAVCILTPGTQLLGQADEDFTIDSMMLKVFDSLTSYEQMLLKCAAVLGETFIRKMLIALMSDPDPRQLALCVQKLFEMQVLTCASLDFGASRSTSTMSGSISFSSTADAMTGGIVSCQCAHLEIEDVCKDLPDYASCAYMRFRLPNFRDTIYSLLTDSQKKEYHERAMRYLEQETRRCKACHGRHFILLLGTRYERYIGRRYKRRRRRGARRWDGERDRESDSGSYSASYSQDSQQSSRLSISRSGRSDDTGRSDGSIHSFLQQITYEDMLLSKIRQSWGDPDDMPAAGYVERSKASNRYLPTGFPWTFMGVFQGKGRVPSAAGLSLTRSFSSCNFTECECTLILTSVYTQILGHCRGAELDEKTMDALLEFAEVCVYISNHAQAQRLLFQARKLLTEAKTEPQFGIKKVEDTREGSYIPSWKWPYLMGRIHTLLGHSRLKMGQYEEAHFQLHLAMAHMGVPFPENRLMLRLVACASRTRLTLTTSFMARAWLGRRSGFAATYSDAIAECLSHLYVVFRDMGDWASARLAATWGINRSLESGFDFLGVCISFANMLEMLQYYGEFVTCAKLEVGAMEVCRNRASYLEIQELVAVGRLYRIVFHSLMTRGRIESAISVGYKTLRIAAAVRATEHRLDVLPGLISCLIARNRVTEAVTLLNELEFISEEDVDKSGITWYYALTMETHLDTGYSVLPYVRCEEFFKREGEALYTGRQPQASHRLYAALWLWCIRLEDWEGAKLWEHLARPEFTVPDMLTVRQFSITCAMIMQGLCITLAHLMDIDDTKGVTETTQKIDKLCKLFSKACGYIRFAESYYRSIKAYFTYLKSNNNKRQQKKALRELRTASEIATRQGNARLAEWCKHNEKMWRGLLAPIKAETWRECAEPDNLVDWHEADKTPPRIMHYTLPLPDCLD